MERYNGVEPDPEGAFVYYDDAQRALDVEREKVKELVANQAEYEKCTDEQITALNQGCLDYEKQIATLQAQLADRDAMILQMGKQAARLAKDGIAAKAQLRQVEGNAETYRKMHAVCTMNLALANNDLTTLRQLVAALPVVDGRMDVECGACYYIRSFVAGQYGIVCGLMTEQSTAMAIKALLEYRATQAAQDAKDAPLTEEQRHIENCCEKPHDCKWGGLGGWGYAGRKYEAREGVK